MILRVYKKMNKLEIKWVGFGKKKIFLILILYVYV